MCQIFIHFPVCKPLRYRVSHSNERRMPYMPGEQLTRSAALASQVPGGSRWGLRGKGDTQRPMWSWDMITAQWERNHGYLGMVAWNMNFIFPFSWECHHPNWLSYFSEGFKPPTRFFSNQPNLMGYNHGQWVQPTHDQGIVMVIYHGIYNQPTMRIAFSCVYIYIYIPDVWIDVFF